MTIPIPDPQPTLFAFWTYDQFPFVVGGPGYFDDNGAFHATTYQMRLARQDLIAVTALKQGAEIRERLKQIEAEHRAAVAALTSASLATTYEALPELATWRRGKGRTPN
jgi:hypothetical protein